MSGGQEDYPSLGKGRAAPAAGVWGPSGPSSTPGAAPAAAPAPAPASGGKDMGKGGGKDWGKDGGKDWGKDKGGKDWGKDKGGKDWGKDGGKDMQKGYGKDGGKDKGWGKDGGKESKGYGQAAEAPSQSSQAAPSVPPPTAAPSMAPTEENLELAGPHASKRKSFISNHTQDPEEPVSHAGTTPHDVAEDGDDKKVFVALLSGKDCECLWLQDRTIRQLKEEAQQKLDIAIKHLIGPDMEPLDEEKMLAEENVMPGTTLTAIAVNQAAEDEKEAAECGNDIVTAAKDGRLGGVRHLLRTVPGAVAKKGGPGHTALHQAALHGRAEICRVLLAAGAELEARDIFFSSTPLHLAAVAGCAEAVKLLLEAKASVTVKDIQGRTPLDHARSEGHDEVVKILENAA